MATTSRPITYQDMLRMPESGTHEEIVNGEVRPLPPAKTPHRRIIDRMVMTLRSSLDKSKVEVCYGSFGVVVRQDPLTCRIPGVALFVRQNAVEVDGYFHSAPELAIEVLSPGSNRREREQKLQDYEAIGVAEVWIVSREAQTVEVMRLQDGKLQTVAILRTGSLRPLHFPDAEIDIERIFPD